MKSRIKWIDIAKGFSIILVIIGHTTDVDLTRGLIFSFHMPLFFVASAYTMNFSDSFKVFIHRNLKLITKMLAMAYGLFVIKEILYILLGNNSYTGIRSFLISTINAIFYSRGVSITVNDIQYEAIGMTWFLVVYAFARCLYDLLHLLIKNKFVRGGVCVCCTLLSFHLSYLPFSFDIVFAVLLFYYFGDILKEFVLSNDGKLKIFIEMIISCVVWYLLFKCIYNYTGIYLELAQARYPWGLISFLCAISGCLMMFSLARIIENILVVSEIFAWIGRNSMMIFSVHYMDQLWMPFINNDHKRIYTMIRVVIDIVISAFIVFVREDIFKLLRYHNANKNAGPS